MSKKENQQSSAKDKEKGLNSHTANGEDQFLTTNQGARINDDQNTLKAGQRGPSIMEDFHFREKMTHFDHERIPERVVHARGAGAHGYFEAYENMGEYTKAGFLQEAGTQTPVFVRFSTVAGSKGSTDLARDVRGFAVKFYTQEGNFDLVGNNMPVFFIQDAVKFPDLIHSVKPEPHNGIPQAASAHDTFWDFISLMPESTHMVMWVMSDRAIPRSFSMMEGFGIHTFRFINSEGKPHFVKFHWKPKLGVNSVTWDEAQKISGNDPDFLRRDLWQSIEDGNYPEFELGVQLVSEEDEHKFDFDLLDPTKIIPEELVPVKIIGKMVLNRNPANFFAETEQVAFHPGHLVPGIDFSNDPLLQGRLFSYTDTQLIRLGGPNFHEIPINRPVTPVHNNQRDGHMRQTINAGQSSYHPNQTGGGCPFQAAMHEGGYAHYAEPVSGNKTKERSKSFHDHYSQAKLFYNSQTEVEKKHIANALKFELGKVSMPAIQERMIAQLQEVDMDLADEVAKHIGVETPVKLDNELNQSIPADGNPEDFQSGPASPSIEKSAALSMEHITTDSIQGRNIAVLVAEGINIDSIEKLQQKAKSEGAKITIIAPTLGKIKTMDNQSIDIQKTLHSTASVLFDALYLPKGTKSDELLSKTPAAVLFVEEMFKHCKAIGMDDMGSLLWRSTRSAQLVDNNENASEGIVLNGEIDQFIKAVANYRFWKREEAGDLPV
ncbi:catalase HPII [Echinicola strongylocentroti]|uniref:Catalase n=1 Tax=Echinicola strongylocentroti TaxID=1795355 RepID=A0A2Z4ILM1_9BACT|nr:catalase [Echinicola strongylocentroti]AWW32022.1 catalase HPII [Echinicola strongylocentroti]